MSNALDSIMDDLQRIYDLLSKHEFQGQAEHVQHLLELAKSDSSRFAEAIVDGGMWGGSGAVWEVGSFRRPEIDEREATRDELAFRKAIIRLATNMDKIGLGTEGSRSVATAFKTWKRMGL